MSKNLTSTDIGRIDYKFLTPPEKKFFDEYGRFLRRERVKYYRVHSFTMAKFYKAGTSIICVQTKNDRPHSVYRLDMSGRAFDVINFE